MCCYHRAFCNRAALRSRVAKHTFTSTGLIDRAEKDRISKLCTVHNKRYNLERFAKMHPGGSDSLLLGQGRSCTVLFETYHSLANESMVRGVLARYYIEDTPPGAGDYIYIYITPFYDAP